MSASIRRRLGTIRTSTALILSLPVSSFLLASFLPRFLWLTCAHGAQFRLAGTTILACLENFKIGRKLGAGSDRPVPGPQQQVYQAQSLRAAVGPAQSLYRCSEWIA